MKLRAAIAFSYQNQSYVAGQEFMVEDAKTADFLLKSGHVVEVTSAPTKRAAAAKGQE